MSDEVKGYDLSGIPEGYELVGVRFPVYGDLVMYYNGEVLPWVLNPVGQQLTIIVRKLEPPTPITRKVEIHKWLVWDEVDGQERVVFATVRWINDCGFFNAKDLGLSEVLEVEV